MNKKFLQKNPKKNRQLGRARHRRAFNIKIDLNEIDGCGLHSSGSEQG
jgi:hypothetical protein